MLVQGNGVFEGDAEEEMAYTDDISAEPAAANGHGRGGNFTERAQYIPLRLQVMGHPAMCPVVWCLMMQRACLLSCSWTEALLRGQVWVMHQPDTSIHGPCPDALHEGCASACKEWPSARSDPVADATMFTTYQSAAPTLLQLPDLRFNLHMTFKQYSCRNCYAADA